MNSIKKNLKKTINCYIGYKYYFNLFFIIIFISLAITSLISFYYEKNYIIFISIFAVLFLVYIWIFLIIYSEKKPRNSILELISSRNLVMGKKKLTGAEVGVFKGSYSSQIINHFKSKKLLLEFYLIDPWKIDNDYNEYGSQNLEIAYELVKKKFLENRNVKIMRTSSSKASKEFSDNYFDFIYIDGNHSYKFVKEDLDLWFPKLNNKGILFGDDYLRPYGVQKAVAKFSHEKKLIVHFTDNGNQYYFIKDNN